MSRSRATLSPARESTWRRRTLAGTSTSLGTTSTGQPASSAEAAPVIESSMARHCFGVEIQTEIGVDDPHHALGRAADGRLPYFGGELSPESRVELLDRDVPQFLGVDERAVHVEQHRPHAGKAIATRPVARRCLVDRRRLRPEGFVPPPVGGFTERSRARRDVRRAAVGRTGQ